MMKKSILLFVLALGLSLSAHAQVYGPSAVGNRFGTYTGGSQGDYSHGARGFVELSPLGITSDQIILPNLFGGYGYQFNPHFYVGGALGLGSHEYFGGSPYYHSYGPEQSFGISLCADLRYYFSDAISTPFLALRTGMSLLSDFDFDFFPYIGGKFGYRFGLNNGRAMNVSMDLSSQESIQLHLVVGYEF